MNMIVGMILAFFLNIYDIPFTTENEIYNYHVL